MAGAGAFARTMVRHKNTPEKLSPPGGDSYHALRVTGLIAGKNVTT